MRSLKPLLATAVILIAFVTIPLFVSPQSIHAQSGVTYDFTGGDDQGWSLYEFTGASPETAGAIGAGGWSSTCRENGGNWYTAVDIYYTLPFTNTMTDIVVHYDATLGTGNIQNATIIADFTLLQDDNPITIGSGVTLEWHGSVTADTVHVYLSSDAWEDNTRCNTGSVLVTSIEIDGFTVPTPTPTISPTPTSYLPPFSHRICTLLLNRAEFRDGWTFMNGAGFASNDPNRFLLLPPGGSAKLTLALSPTKQYGVSVLLRGAQAGDNGTITLGIGESAAYSIPIEGHTDLRGFTTAAITYQPDETGGYTVQFARPATDTGNVVVEYFCLQVKTDDSMYGDSGNGQENDRCSTCVAPDWFGDLGGILNWLICQLKNLLTCYVSQFLIYIMNLVNKVTGFALDIFVWMVDGFNASVAWTVNLVTSIGRFFSGSAQNVGAQASNAMHTSGVTSALNTTASTVRDIPTMIINTGAGLLRQASDAILTSTSLIQIILRLIVVAFSAMYYALFGLFPLVLGALIDGFNTTGRLTSLTLTCTSPSSALYYPCLGFYVLDNTILSGPAKYLIPIVMGLWAVDTFAWAFNRIKEEISK